MGNKQPKIKLSEIKKHNKINDCWIICNNKVYDITKFLKFHPGSREILFKKAGKDITYDMKFHSEKANRMLTKFFIGYIDRE